MSVWEAAFWSLTRAVIVGGVIAAIVPQFLALLARLRQADSKFSLVLVMAIAVPMVIPGLLIGYAFRPEGLRWVITPWKADILHGVIAIAKSLPWSMLIASLVGVRAAGRMEAVWEQTRSQRSAGSHRVGRWRLAFERRRGAVIAGVIAGVWAFGEAEVAALLQARGWTEWTFRKLAGGWLTSDVALALWPVVVINLAAIFVVWRTIAGRGKIEGTDSEFANSNSLSSRALNDRSRTRRSIPQFAIAACLLSVTVVIPICRLAADAIEGFDALARQRTFWKELVCTIAAATAGTTIAISGAKAILSHYRLRIFAVPLLVVGAFGPMLASIIVQSVGGQFLEARSLGLSDAGLSLISQYVALGCVLLPMAIALEVVLQRRTSGRPTKVTRLLLRHRNSAVRRHAEVKMWRNSTGPRVAAWGFLFWIAFWDLQTAALLAPPGWATAPGRLYNLAHYGQSQTLAAMLLFLSATAFAIPALVLTITSLWHRRW